ncbi:MAG: F0F1 ATP synthase subunit A [Planctomycetia bacterium]|uniref:ATP synthase subunit a n=1 Tax=Candidatus Brocadia sapporoensis TaxID=392547 RepID=A0A1V6LZS7_9BACT|nr:F0F1 ATP synthase subunit A [Candidatus Brocadia sapporoensis]MCC7240027.1 F0F1 ATP synthase subunit A [Candidatus Brocadia sp.]QOJ06200.1 MAG: F0F1 ATP synthase subunit A [Planctomycetia bacterium]TVL95887.1 MAG: ATP synthase F0 subunit A [Candidatus Brocadia sp. BL1]MDG6005941.1 ATP synthase F0 subunit A [Candidatus Brocadia sp.]OQD45672.1 ATP synthase F0 subunit A [Candidatus Brocadia sapporoensis]
MKIFNVFPETIFSIGPVHITDTVITTWLVMIAIITISYFATRKLSVKPSFFQEIIEAVFEAIEVTIKDILPVEPWLVIPVLGTLWILIGFSNLAGLIPGLKTPTADLNTTFAFALISFSMTHVIGIATQGLKGYLMHYKEPTWLLLPFHLIAEVTRTIALAVRLFGNMLSGDMITIILLGIVGLLVPVPFSLLHIIIALIQAYIFGVLTLVFIAGGIRTKS